MTTWQQVIETKLARQKYKAAEIRLNEGTVNYSKKIKLNRSLQVLTGNEEIVRAFLIDRLVNELHYKPEMLETDKEYSLKAGYSKSNQSSIDLLVKDEEGNPFFFIEVKAPGKYAKDRAEIEEQLFTLAQAEEQDYKKKVKYIVYYSVELQEGQLIDKAIVIDFVKYPTYEKWEADGFVSIGSELTAGYGEPRKQPLIKGDDKHDLRVKISHEEIDGLGRILHNVLWGGGGTNDSDIFYSLVNIILAKIQDEYERKEGEEYQFQVYQFGENIESGHRLFERINSLYKRALRDQLNVTDEQKINEDNVINRNKFPLNKLIFTVQVLERFSLLAGRSSLDGKDILGDFFERITRDGFKQHNGQFFTPTPIVKFILYALQLDVLAIDKLNKERQLPFIIDPSSGSGTFLVEAMKLITKEVKYRQRHKLKANQSIVARFEELFSPDHNENKWAKEYLFGSEINFDLGTASKVNMILHGDGSSNIFIQSGLLPFRFYTKENELSHLANTTTDCLYFDKEVNEKFDVVISNPPFSVELDSQSQREIRNTFIFGDKRNSENLFIERYYQLLKEKGRLAVVLPESIFDTIENKYIRLFIFKYFNVKAIISLPQITFEPYTTIKTSILFAQKKTKAEIEEWNLLWERYGKEWSLLKTNVKHYYQYFVEGKPINKKWSFDAEINIQENNIINIRKHLFRFLKDYIRTEDKELDITELLIKYAEEITNLSKLEKETEIFGCYNAWWVFGEVAKALNYDIFMAEAENIGYKRSKKGDKPMPNELYDIEHAPTFLDCNEVLANYTEEIAVYLETKNTLLKEKAELLSSDSDKEADKTKKRLEKLTELLEGVELILANLRAIKLEVEQLLTTYYEQNKLKAEYMERNDEQLIKHFKKGGVLYRYRSEEILLRKSLVMNILDAMRQEVIWD